MFDSQHWYTREGSAAHFQGDRPTTLRDARAQNLVPSVSGILSIIAKPALVSWFVDQGILAALTLPRIDGEREEDYIRRIKADSRKQAQAAAEIGSEIHAAVEDSFANRAGPMRYAKHVSAVHQLLADNFPHVRDWVSEKRFAHPAGFGGACDLHSPSTGIVVDFKSTDIAPEQVKKLHYEQNEQLAAYHWGLGLPDGAVGCNIFVSRTHPGHARCHVWSVEDMRHGRSVFEAALVLHKCRRKYDGSW